MHTENVLQLVAAAGFFAVAVMQYRKRSETDGKYGSQSAVLLLIAGLIFLVLGLDLLEYRPSAAELGQ
jgi:hypothetical protein